MSTWRSARNVDERLLEPRSILSFQVQPSLHAGVSWSVPLWMWTCCQSPCMPVSATIRIHLLDRHCGSWGAGLTMSQGRALSRKPAHFPEHPKGLCRTKCFRLLVRKLQGQKNSLRLAQYPPANFSPAQGGSEGEKLEVKSMFFFWVSHQANRSRIFHLGVKRTKGGTVKFQTFTLKYNPYISGLHCKKHCQGQTAYFKTIASKISQLTILKA